MATPTQIVFVLLALAIAQPAAAEADRDSLIEAWEEHFAALPGTAQFELVAEGVYRLKDTDLPYEGELKVVGALVRDAETSGIETGFSHFGMVDIDLPGLPEERLSSQSYYYWLGDRQTLHYSTSEQRWMSAADYQASITELYSPNVPFGAMNFMLNYGIWVFLIALIVYVFVAVNRQAKKARSLMDETEAINQHASENLDRSERMQDEVMAITREMRDIQLQNNELLRKMLDALSR